MMGFYEDIKASVHFSIEQLLIEKQKWIDERLESLHQRYNKL